MSDTYTVADYLLDRLAELGVGHVFGVPGDFTLRALDHVVRHPRLRWVGCTNELNAGYAADGYGRMRGVAALMTTFGVGELSAINALAGSYAELVPVIHIVGGPSTETPDAHRIVHHSLGDGVFSHFLDMHAKITCARASLNTENATAEIDRVLATVRNRHLPGYLLLPVNVAGATVEPPGAELQPSPDITDAEALQEFGDAANRLLQSVAGPADVRVLVGVEVHRLGADGEMDQLVAAGPLLHATSLWAKSVLDESNPNYIGIYAGRASHPEVREAIEDAGVLIVAGVQFTDLNSGFFTHRITRGRTIELGPSTASVGYATFGPISMAAALKKLAGVVGQLSGAAPEGHGPQEVATQRPVPSPTAPLDQAQLWETVANHLRAGDVVFAETGTPFFGMVPHRLPQQVDFFGQPLWASIGYALPAMLGACLARPGRRGVLLIGDGAAQMTVQELSTMIRQGIRALVLVVDNDGYTTERAIHGPDEPYNDIARWAWEHLPAAMAPGTDVRSRVVQTAGSLQNALDEETKGGRDLTLIRAVVPRLDVPELLTWLARALRESNARRG